MKKKNILLATDNWTKIYQETVIKNQSINNILKKSLISNRVPEK